MTSDLPSRVSEHKQDLIDGFTKRYAVHELVYAEEHVTMADAIAREKLIKVWKRAWKIALIEERNPEWRDLYFEMTGLQDTYIRHSGQATAQPSAEPEPSVRLPSQ